MSEWKLAPVEPTEAMLDASSAVTPLGWLCWSAMLDAAPQPVVTDEMVERAARAMYERTGKNLWDECPADFSETWRSDARAALTAALGGQDE